MSTDLYEVFLSDDSGNRITILSTIAALDFTMVANGVGAASLVIPKSNNITLDTFQKDYWIEIERNGILQGGAPYLIRGKRVNAAGDATTYTIRAAHANHLLGRRIIAYYSGHAQALASAEACDDLVKRLVRYNLGANAQDADRDQAAPDLSAFFTVEADSGEGPDTTRAFSRRILINTIDDIMADSYEQGTYLFYGIELNDDRELEFKTKINQWGENRIGKSLLSSDLNLAEAFIDYDWFEEVTVGYALGSDTAVSRNVQVYAADAAEDSVWNWIERTSDARDLSNTTSLLNEAKAFVRENRERITAGGRVQETPGFRYGNHWAWGDRFPVDIDGVSLTAWLNKVSISIQEQEETISAQIEVIV